MDFLELNFADCTHSLTWIKTAQLKQFTSGDNVSRFTLIQQIYSNTTDLMTGNDKVPCWMNRQTQHILNSFFKLEHLWPYLVITNSCTDMQGHNTWNSANFSAIIFVNNFTVSFKVMLKHRNFMKISSHCYFTRAVNYPYSLT